MASGCLPGSPELLLDCSAFPSADVLTFIGKGRTMSLVKDDRAGQCVAGFRLNCFRFRNAWHSCAVKKLRGSAWSRRVQTCSLGLALHRTYGQSVEHCASFLHFPLFQMTSKLRLPSGPMAPTFSLRAMVQPRMVAALFMNCESQHSGPASESLFDLYEPEIRGGKAAIAWGAMARSRSQTSLMSART